MQILPSRDLAWPIVWAGVVEIARSEGCRLRAYRDVAGVWTIGWGHTQGVRRDTRITQSQADATFLADLAECADGVSRRLCAPANPRQFAAMVSLAYNIGLTGFARSTVLKAHNRSDAESAARAFALWNKARVDGRLRVVAGLTARRAREAALYLAPAPEARPPLDAVPVDAAGALMDMPEAAPESRLAASPIAQSGAVSIATGGLAAASSVSADVRDIAWGFGIDPLLIVAGVAIVVGAVVLWQRHKQRRLGWA